VHNRDLLVLLLLLASTGDGEKHDDRRGFVSRIAARATGRVVDVVDPNVVLAGVDVDALMARVDVDALMARVDVDALMARIDVNALLDRIDVNALLDRIDVDRLMARVDVDAILDGIDMEELAARSGIPDIVRESTGALAGSALDVLRRQLASIDVVMSRAFYRLTGRSPSARPDAPSEIGAAALAHGGITGRYAGPLTRLFAFVVDALIVWSVWTLAVLGVAFVASVFVQDGLAPSGLQAIVGVAILALWALVYYTLGPAIAGKTVGMGVIGLMIVTRAGAPISGRAAFVRTLVLPLSALPLGLGLVGILIGRERRALHDVAAGTAVVYDWGDRPAELRAPLQEWLDRKRA
jgi:uncharacterized RDD family membrane protein YckC